MPTPKFDIPTFVLHALPPNYRLPKWIAAVRSYLYGLTWRYGIFQAYQSGELQIPWSYTATYNTGNTVVYNFSTYESLTNTNTGNQPDISPAAWTLRCGSFIGANERVKYDGRYLTLTWALNRYFGTTFRQPPYPAPYGAGTQFSDIYITNVVPTFTSFVCYATEAGTGDVYTTASTSVVFTGEDYATASSYAFIIHIPVSVYTALGTTTAISQSVVRAFADKYVPAGISYNISTY